MLEYVISFIAPHSCIVCAREGSLICNACVIDNFPALPDSCFRCQKISAYGRVCATCRPRSSLHSVWVRTSYEGAARHLVRKLKFERAGRAAVHIAELIDERLPHDTRGMVIVPLPTASSRVRMRGYDHAERIGRSLAKRRGMVIYRSALCRLGATRQVGASRQKRLTQLEDAFYCPNPKLIAGKDVLLIDDVVTTGASLEQAAKVLRQAGVRRVSAATFARKAVTFTQ